MSFNELLQGASMLPAIPLHAFIPASEATCDDELEGPSQQP